MWRALICTSNVSKRRQKCLTLSDIDAVSTGDKLNRSREGAVGARGQFATMETDESATSITASASVQSSGKVMVFARGAQAECYLLSPAEKANVPLRRLQ